MPKIGDKVYWVGKDGLLKTGYLKGFVTLEKLKGTHALVKMNNGKKVFLNIKILSATPQGNEKDNFPTFKKFFKWVKKLFTKGEK